MNPLTENLRLGRYTLRNRLVMAPMTRSRADDSTGVPSPLTAQYYAQRTDAGLIIAEGTFPSPMGKGYVRTPGIHSDEQIFGWKRVTDAVHARGGLIFLQLMHTGRISHPSLLPNEATPVAPSAIAAEGQVYTATGPQDFVVPRALETSEIADIVGEYRHATRHALLAGFDGVELHAASGYLPEQFLSSGTNRRTDRYGGSPVNRARFIIEIIEAMIGEAGSDRIGIKIAPEMGFNSVTDAAPPETYEYLVRRLGMLKLAYIHLTRTGSAFDYRALIRPLYDGTLLLGGGFDRDSAASLIAQRSADAAVFGSLYLANPDLLQRFVVGAPLNAPERDTFYSDGPHGYIDYPALEIAR
jgi:N-ethylmaleimide reductase